jgi:hypothetical protein
MLGIINFVLGKLCFAKSLKILAFDESADDIKP